MVNKDPIEITQIDRSVEADFNENRNNIAAVAANNINNSVYRLEGDHQSYTQQSLMGVNDMTIRNTKKSVQLDSGNNFSVV